MAAANAMAAKQTGGSEPTRQPGGPRPLAATIPGLARRVLGSRGFAVASIVTEWEAIVGAERARVCRPEKLSFPRGERSAGTLKVRAGSGDALALQHDAPAIVERINRFFGYRAVAKLQIVNGPVGGRSPQRPAPPPPPDPNRAGRIAAAVESVDDPELQEILQRFGRSILERPNRSGSGGSGGTP
ncbi:MAG: DUF721 domain-containing protein [Alphaproteobacteria bacterium]